MEDKMNKIQCGNANPKGNVSLFYKGGCKKELELKDAYRCTGCGGWFHKECILKHFELEREHDYGRKNERARLRIKIEGMKNKAKLPAGLKFKKNDIKKLEMIESWNHAIDKVIELLK